MAHLSLRCGDDPGRCCAALRAGPLATTGSGNFGLVLVSEEPIFVCRVTRGCQGGLALSSILLAAGVRRARRRAGLDAKGQPTNVAQQRWSLMWLVGCKADDDHGRMFSWALKLCLSIPVFSWRRTQAYTVDEWTCANWPPLHPCATRRPDGKTCTTTTSQRRALRTPKNPLAHLSLGCGVRGGTLTTGEELQICHDWFALLSLLFVCIRCAVDERGLGSKPACLWFSWLPNTRCASIDPLSLQLQQCRKIKTPWRAHLFVAGIRVKLSLSDGGSLASTAGHSKFLWPAVAAEVATNAHHPTVAKLNAQKEQDNTPTVATPAHLTLS